MPDTVASSLWLSLVDILVVFAVLAFLLLVCLGLRFFSRGSRDEGSAEDDEDTQVDAAAGDEPASELPMIQSVPATGEDAQRLSAVPIMVDSGHLGTDGAFTVGLDEGDLRTATAQSRVFRITVNGKAFEVGVEQVAGTQPVRQVAAAPAPFAEHPVVAPSPPPGAPHPAPSAHATDTSNLMKSPLPGKILKVFAAPGKAFKRGDTLLIIEAMKMENEILAPRDCVVGEVHVEVSQSVKTGEPLLRMR
ncbi:MAG: acetyl-CoA carboxylase biotin carboxyl carrier protein subunit [Caldisericia bacterium]